MILKFTGDDSVLNAMGFQYNEHGDFYCMGHPDTGLYIWRKTKEISLNPFTREVTKMIYEFLIKHAFIINDLHTRLTYNKMNQIVENYSFRKHTVIGALGFGYSEEDAKEIEDNYKELQLKKSQIERLKELYDLSLIE